MTDLSEFIQIIKSDEKAVDELRDCFARKGTVMDVMTALAEIAQQYGYDLNFDDLTRATRLQKAAALSFILLMSLFTDNDKTGKWAACHLKTAPPEGEDPL